MNDFSKRHATDRMIGNPQRLRQVFINEFRAKDIAVPLLSFDTSSGAAEAARILERRRTNVAGVRHEGQLTGFVFADELTEGCICDAMHSIEPTALIGDDTSLARVIIKLTEQELLFVSSINSVIAVITRSDLEKPPVRMWLFGVITLLELAMGRAIDMRFPDRSWTKLISAGRLAKAQHLRDMRTRSGHNVDLLSCLQLSDLSHIFMKDPELRRLTRQTSRSQGEKTIKQLNQLRDHLAHAQPIVQHNWSTIADLYNVLDRTLEYLTRTVYE